MTNRDIYENRHQGAETSSAAFDAPRAGFRELQRDQVAAAISASGTRGLTTEEVSEKLGIPYTAASARMSELKRDAWIIDSGRRRETRHGRTARVMIVPVGQMGFW